MAIVLEPIFALVEEEIASVIAAGITKAVESAVESSVTSAITLAIGDAITLALQDAIAQSMDAVLMGRDIQNAIEDQVIKTLKEQLLDKLQPTIGPAAVDALASLLSGTDVRSSIDQTLQAVLSSGPYLDLTWVFRDSDYLALQRFIEAISDLSIGSAKPIPQDACTFLNSFEEIKTKILEEGEDSILLGLRLFPSQLLASSFLAEFAVFDGKLKRLCEDFLGGPKVVEALTVIQKLSSVSAESTSGITSEAIGDFGFIRSVFFSVVSWNQPTRVFNARGSGQDTRVRPATWIGSYRSKCVQNLPRLVCAINSVPADHSPEPYTVQGGHVYLTSERNRDDYQRSLFIIPLCPRHNTPANENNMTTNSPLVVLKITHWIVDPEEWQPGLDFDAVVPSHVQPFSARSMDQDKWVYDAAEKLASGFVESPYARFLKSFTATVMDKVKDLIHEAGDEAQSYCRDQGNQIMQISWIPIYGQIRAGIMLSHLKDDSMNVFYSACARKVMSFATSSQASRDRDEGYQAELRASLDSAQFTAAVQKMVQAMKSKHPTI